MNRNSRLLIRALLTILLCNSVFVGAYLVASFIPSEKVVQSLQKSNLTGVLKTPMYSIERATTGWGIDYGTECVAISNGLLKPTEFGEINPILFRFYDSYLPYGQNDGIFDPCDGLQKIISSDKIEKLNSESISYARNWWGMSVLIQIAIVLFGLATAKTYLFIATIITMAVFYYKFTQHIGNWKAGLVLLFPFIFFSDFQELHNSFPYSVYTIQIFISASIIIGVIMSSDFSYHRLLNRAILLAAVYNFMFWFGFHIVITLVVSVIFLLLFQREKIAIVYGKILVYILGSVVGFLSTTVIKWIVSIGIFGGEVSGSIKNAVQVRLSTGTEGLSGPLLDYSANFSQLPVPIRTVVLNLMVFASKIIDPRNASALGVILILFSLATITTWFVYRFRIHNVLSRVSLAWFLPILMIPFIYLGMTANHSFNHAVIAYRSIPLSAGFLLAFVYQSYVNKHRNSVVTKN